MLTTLRPVLFLLLLIQGAQAQVQRIDLDQDPVFRGVLARRMSYPVGAGPLGIYAKIYAGFRINQRGHVQDVCILNPTRVGHGFEDEVIRTLKRLPPLPPRHEGSYALPVTFAVVDHTNGATVVSPSGSLMPWFLNERTLLQELRVVGNGTVTQRGRYVPFTVGQVLTIDP